MTKHVFVFWLVNLEESINILQKLAYLKPPYNIKTWIQISRLLCDFPLKIQHVDVKGTGAEHTKIKRLAQNFLCKKKPDRKPSLARSQSTIVPVHAIKAYGGAKVNSTYY